MVEIGLRFDLLLFLCFENRVDCLDDRYVSIGFAVDDDVVNVLFDAGHVDRMLLGQSIVPAAIPNPEEVRVFLIGAGQLRASKLLYVNVAFGVGVFGKLGLRARCRRQESKPNR